MTAGPTHVIVGPERHGVVRFGLELNAALGTVGVAPTVARSLDATGAAGVHVQFTDHLFGRSATDAATAVARLAERVHARGARITVTLHDLPQPSDGEHHAERARAYAEVARVADAVVVSSDHERMLLSALSFERGGVDAGGSDGEVSVIPLPVPASAAPAAHRRPTDRQSPSVGVFGYLYPGKGHLEVLAAMRGLPRQVWMLAVGEPSAGHEDLIDALADTARRAGRRYAITGHVPDHALTATLQAVTVPVSHHRHVSASGSLNAWLAAGRRPLAPITRYTSEIHDRNPGALLLYPDHDDGLRSALAGALAAPETTWLATGFTAEPTVRGAARRYADAFEAWHR